MKYVTGLFKCQLDTWGRSKGCQTGISRQFKERFKEGIAKEHNTGVERTIGYSANLDALRQELGMGPKEADSQLI